MTNIIKRDGRIVPFDPTKIINAVEKAFYAVDGEVSDYAKQKACNITEYIAGKIAATQHDYTVEEIQDMVERGLMSTKRDDVAKAFILYRDERTKARGNTIDGTILGIIGGTDEYWMNENSNKNAQIASTQRDYMAGAVSTDISRRELLPQDVVEAHDNGLIHFHDVDYFAQRVFNCCLVNLEDMLQNGTVINKTLIEKPHTFVTACNIATQIMAQIASGQYGGQTISLAHLAPFVDMSRQKIKAELLEDLGKVADSTSYNDIQFNAALERRVKKEIEKGVQVLQYQINTLNTSNGQTPFVSIGMYLNEAKNEQEKSDLVLIIEEVLKQRIRGTKNEKGVWITPAFPKLLYVLEDDNCEEGTKYWWLTELAAKCTAKRMVPDYISEKIMLRDKINANGEGDVYPCMGCRSFLTPDRSGNGFDNIAKAKNYNGKPKYYGRLT